MSLQSFCPSHFLIPQKCESWMEAAVSASERCPPHGRGDLAPTNNVQSQDKPVIPLGKWMQAVHAHIGSIISSFANCEN